MYDRAGPCSGPDRRHPGPVPGRAVRGQEADGQPGGYDRLRQAGGGRHPPPGGGEGQADAGGGEHPPPGPPAGQRADAAGGGPQPGAEALRQRLL